MTAAEYANEEVYCGGEWMPRGQAVQLLMAAAKSFSSDPRIQSVLVDRWLQGNFVQRAALSAVEL